MAATTYLIQYLDWDTRLFGTKMGEVKLDSERAGFQFSEAGWRETIQSARNESYQFLFCQFNAGYQEITAILMKQGAVVGDILVTLALDLARISGAIINDGEPAASLLELTEASIGDLPAVIDIARNSFTYSRFFQDPRFDAAKARQFYPNWIRDSFGAVERIFILQAKTGQSLKPVLGFISLQFKEAEREIVIRLIAIDESQRGKGYAQSFIDWLIREAYRNGFTRIKVGTQAGNTPAIHLYQKNGFQTINTKNRLHIWLD
jgi:ribosomal protein S18 acetylase RimI-like enzyme